MIHVRIYVDRTDSILIEKGKSIDRYFETLVGFLNVIRGSVKTVAEKLY